MKKKDPALLLAKEYRDEYRQTAASRKEQRCVGLLGREQHIHCAFARNSLERRRLLCVIPVRNNSFL